MPVAKPEPDRAQIEDLGESLAMTMPPPPGTERASDVVFRAILLLASVASWIVFLRHRELASAGSPLPKAWPPDPWFVVWIACTTCGLLSAVFFVSWLIAGRERVTVTGEGLSIRVRPLGRRRDYPIGDVRNLRVVDPAPGQAGGPPRRLRGTAIVVARPIAFEHGEQTVRFGANLDESDAAKVVELIQSRFGQYMGK